MVFSYSQHDDSYYSETETQNNPGAILQALEYYEYQVKHPHDKNNKFIDPLKSVEVEDGDSEGKCNVTTPVTYSTNLHGVLMS